MHLCHTHLMPDKEPVYVIYDHECPFCRTYAKLVRLKEAAGAVELINAREQSSIMTEITQKGFDMDQGMIVKMNTQIYYGAEAMHILGLLSTRSGLFNRLNYHIFKSRTVSKILYPLLRSARNIALKMMRIPLIKDIER